MSVFITYDEFLSEIPPEMRSLVDIQDTSINDKLIKLSRIPSHVFSMMTPKLTFYRQARGSKDKKYLKLFYRPRKFPTIPITQKNEDRGDVCGIKSFTYTSNELIALISKNSFEFHFDVSSPYMFFSGHPDNKDVMEFFKASRTDTDMFTTEFGWNLSGIPEVDKAVELLGYSYPFTAHNSNWKLDISADRVTGVTTTGWAGVNETTIKKVCVGTGRSAKLSLQIQNYINEQKEANRLIDEGKTDKKGDRVLVHQLKKTTPESLKELQRVYGEIMKDLKNKKNSDNGVLFGSLLDALQSDVEQMEKDSGYKIKIVLGKYNSTKDGFYSQTDDMSIARVLLPISGIEEKYFSKGKDSSSITIDTLLTNICRDYLNNDNFLRTEGSTVSPLEEISPNVKVKYIPIHKDSGNVFYILIDDFNRYHNFKEIKGALGKTTQEKTDIALNNNVPIIDLERMNNVVLYPVTLQTNVDESLQSIIMTKHKKDLKENGITGEEFDERLANEAYLYLPLNVPFSMMGNFLLKPFQTIMIKYGSEKFDRFFTLINLKHTISENGTFGTSYECRQVQY